MRYGIFEKLSP